MTGTNLLSELVEDRYAEVGLGPARGSGGPSHGLCDRDAGLLEQLAVQVTVDFLGWDFDIHD
jgi:hypothetical protein